MAGRLDGRVTIVTGGGHGIGKAYAARLAVEGARVVIAELDGAGGSVVAAELTAQGREEIAVQTDVASEASVNNMAQQTILRFGRIDVLVNNAAIFATVPMSRSPFDQISVEEWDRMMSVNVKGTWLASRAVVPQMRKQGWGRIVNVASVAGKEGNPNASHYSASKAGLIALTKSLAKELATQGVLVNAVAPAAANTAMFATMTRQHIDFMLGKIPMGRFIEVQEIAAGICWLASEDCSFTTGSVLDLSGGRATY